MNARLAPLVSAIFLAAVCAATPVSAQSNDARFTGRITDESGAALPGATITITSSSLSAPIAIVSDMVGQYLSPTLPPGTYTLTFEMPGFETRTNKDVIIGAGDVFVLDRQLGLASLAEKVEVVAPVIVPPKPPREVEPAIEFKPVPKEVLASVCGPGQATGPEMSVARILGHRSDGDRQLFGKGDALVLDAGSDSGLSVGENFVVRRRFRIGDKTVPVKYASFGDQVAGLIQVVGVEPASSVAVVVYACGEFRTGDPVVRFDALPMITQKLDGVPAFDNPAKIIIGDDGQTLGATQQLMVINFGTLHGVQRGQALTIFRKPHSDRGPIQTIGEGVVIAVREESATIRIEKTRDAVSVGDMVALHR